MKKFFLALPLSLFICCFIPIKNVNGQFLKKIKNEVKSRAENNIIRKVGNATDRAVDNTVNGTSNDKKQKEEATAVNAEKPGKDENLSKNTAAAKVADYKSYDFVPGDKIIFQPDLSSESDAELPARFTLHRGNAEIQTYEGEKILHLDAGDYATVSPLMNSHDYLPEQFTLEFDMMYENDESYFKYVNDFIVAFNKPEDNNYDGYPLYEMKIISNTRVVLGPKSGSGQKFPEGLVKSMNSNNTWHHIAIYVRKNIAKAYIDEYRVSASNTMPLGAGKLYLRTDGHYGFKIKNFRLAAGGDDKYNKIVTDGKFITHGILFDVNKSTIKPESMGAINEIVKLMKDHQDLKFEIDGHTDSDGNDDANMKLSQSRAHAVKDQLIKMGIDESRLTAKGFGETKPIDKNDNAEGKANNRRVEFVKI